MSLGLRIQVFDRSAVQGRDSLFLLCYPLFRPLPLWAKLLIGLAFYNSLQIAPPPLQGFTEAWGVDCFKCSRCFRVDILPSRGLFSLFLCLTFGVHSSSAGAGGSSGIWRAKPIDLPFGPLARILPPSIA